jgi:hypothetical protein
MNARRLLGALRGAGVNLTPEPAGGLLVDAPAGALTDTMRASLAENKDALIELLERERARLEAANGRGLIIRWSEYPVWIKLHDPLTGEWHEVKASECLPGVLEAANAHRKRLRNASTGASRG